jgi:hypothetical protein
MILSAEQKKRKVWMQDQTKQIKEATVKGLEPEIQRLMAQHEAEVPKLAHPCRTNRSSKRFRWQD